MSRDGRSHALPDRPEKVEERLPRAKVVLAVAVSLVVGSILGVGLGLLPPLGLITLGFGPVVLPVFFTVALSEAMANVLRTGRRDRRIIVSAGAVGGVAVGLAVLAYIVSQ